MSIPDPNRGTMTVYGSYDAHGNLSGLGMAGGFTDFVSLDGNRVGELCVSSAGVPRSRYVHVAEDLVPVTDPTELQGQYFDEYENCAHTGTSRFLPDGSFVFEATGGLSDPPDAGIAQAFTEAGLEEQKSNGIAVLRAKAFKYTFDGITKYVYLMVSTRKDSTTPETNGDTDYVLMGVSQLPR